MIQTFSCKNFRNINVENLKLEKLNILIGPNNSGKTNFIKALSFFANMIISGKDNIHKSSFLNEVGVNHRDKLINRYADETKEVSFEWGIKLGKKDVNYKFSFAGGEKRTIFTLRKKSWTVRVFRPGMTGHLTTFAAMYTKKTQGTFQPPVKKTNVSLSI